MTQLAIPRINIIMHNIDYKGRVFDRFFPVQERGQWFIYGRNKGYADALVSKCGTTDKPMRKKLWNKTQYKGFRTKRDCAAVCNVLNGIESNIEINVIQ